MPTITAFAASPDRGQGLARDMRIRWAMEEVGQPYDVQLLTFEEMKEPPHLARNPFGQIPTFEDGDVVLFDSSAILLHIADQHTGLWPQAVGARARAISWIFAAVTNIEPPIIDRDIVTYFEGDRSWAAERMTMVNERVRQRLHQLTAALGDAEWLVGPFSLADLVMVTVLRRLGGSGILEEFSNLTAYVARGAARPAYRRAFAAQLEVWEESQRRT